VDSANKCAAKEIAELPFAGSGYQYGLDDYFGLVPTPSLDPYGMTFDCVGSDCVAEIQEVGSGFLALPPGDTTVTYDATNLNKVLCFQKIVCDLRADGIPTTVTVQGVGTFTIPDCTCAASPVIYFQAPVIIVIVTYSTALDVSAGTACKATDTYPKLESLPYAGSGYEYGLIDQSPTCDTAGTGDFNQDGNFNVLDIVASITMMTTGVVPDASVSVDCYIATIDMNSDGEMNVLDMVAMTKTLIAG